MMGMTLVFVVGQALYLARYIQTTDDAAPAGAGITHEADAGGS
jgi:hypothetical protein